MDYLQKLKDYRKAANLTQQEVAELLQIPQSQIVRYEQGKNELPIRYLIQLCTIYGITPNDILGFNVAPTGRTDGV